MSLEALPDEIIQNILYCSSPEDTLDSFQLISRRFKSLVDDPLLWKYHCIAVFTHWHPRHQLQAKLKLPASNVHWKDLFTLRRKQNFDISADFDAVIHTKVDRFKRYAQIGQYGYDAKDFLLRQCDVDGSVDDGLARK